MEGTPVFTWLILDCDYLCYRAFHSTGELAHGGIPTGVIYGFLKEVMSLQDRFCTNRVAFCFDYGEPKRKTLLPGYKEKRKQVKYTPEQIQARVEMKRQVANLRTTILHRLGYNNVFAADGYEADDMIASVVRYTRRNDNDAVIVTADKDMYQLLRPGVVAYNPQQDNTTTHYSLLEKYGVRPEWWATVKALAGCDTDNVPGIRGVGELTACRYINKQLTLNTTKKIDAVAPEIIERNMPLVRIPFPGTPEFEPKADQFNPKEWRALCRELGMASLEHRTFRRENNASG
jgi:DNA polymerase-1